MLWPRSRLPGSWGQIEMWLRCSATVRNVISAPRYLTERPDCSCCKFVNAFGQSMFRMHMGMPGFSQIPAIIERRDRAGQFRLAIVRLKEIELCMLYVQRCFAPAKLIA